MPRSETPGFRLSYASQVIQKRFHYLHPGGYQPFKVIQGNATTLAHFDEQYIPCLMS